MLYGTLKNYEQKLLFARAFYIWTPSPQKKLTTKANELMIAKNGSWIKKKEEKQYIIHFYGHQSMTYKEIY